MTNQKILDNAPKGAGVFDITGEYFDEYNNHLNKQGFWSQKDTSPVSPRSLEDIRRIVELEKERDIRDLEQQAKGLEDLHKLVEKCGAKSLMSFLLIEEADELRAQAKALKEQDK